MQQKFLAFILSTLLLLSACTTNNYQHKDNNLKSSETENITESDVYPVATLKQNGDFPAEYIPVITMYSDGTFDFLYNSGEGMYTHSGSYLYGSEETDAGYLMHYFNCSVENCDLEDGLEFCIAYLEGADYVEFETIYESGEFGMTFCGDLFTLEILNEEVFYSDRGYTLYVAPEDDSGQNSYPATEYGGYVKTGFDYLEGDIRNNQNYIISDEIEYKQICFSSRVDYANALNNADYCFGGNQMFNGKVIYIVSDSFLLETSDGIVHATFPDGYNPGVMINHLVTVYGTLNGTSTYTAINEYGVNVEKRCPLLHTVYLDGSYNDSEFYVNKSTIGAEILGLNGKWQQCNFLWMPYFESEYILLDNTSLSDGDPVWGLRSFTILSAEKSRTTYGEEYIEMICNITYSDGSGGNQTIKYRYIPGYLEFVEQDKYYMKTY